MNGALDEGRLRARVGALGFIGELRLFADVDSTNDALRRLADGGSAEWTVVAAERQLRGRGRLGRAWHSPPGVGLYLSVLLRPREPWQWITRWTLAAAVAASEACRQATGVAVEIEWPNDLVHRGRKLGGVLAELRGGPGDAELVLGLGLNVSHEAADFPPPLDRLATSLALAGAARPVDREALLAAYLERLWAASRQLRDGQWLGLAERWLELAPAARGRRVVVRETDRVTVRFNGTTCGIDADGALLVQRSNGATERVTLVDAVTGEED